jgi:ParB-like chromosome segregation protein Spo0J
MESHNGEVQLHVVCNRYRDLTREEFDALCDSISRQGLLQDIWTWRGSDGTVSVIDGKHRLLACQKVQVEPRFREWRGPAEQLEDFVDALNRTRRQLTPEDKREIIAKEIQKDPGRSNLQIAKLLGFSDHTVAAVRDELERRSRDANENGQGDKPKMRTDTRGRKQPARKPRRSKPSRKPAREDERQTESLADELGTPVPPGMVSVFQRRQDFNEMRNQLNAMQRKLQELKEQSGIPAASMKPRHSSPT